MLTVPFAEGTAIFIPVGVSLGNMHPCKSRVAAVFISVLKEQLAGAGTPTASVIVIAVLVPAAFVAVKVTAEPCVGAVGVPEMIPLAVSSTRPAGKLLLGLEKLSNGGLVPLMFIGVIGAPKASEVDSPLTGAVITGTAVGMMVRATALEPVNPAELVAPTDRLKIPDSVGVPAIAPVVVFKLNPAGRTPDISENAVMGPLIPLVVIWYTVALMPTVPLAVAALLKVGPPMALTRKMTFKLPMPDPAEFVARSVTA